MLLHAAVLAVLAAAKLPTIWLYAANDPLFSPSLARALFGAFSRTHPDADTFVALPAFCKAGHGLVQQPGALPLWTPAVEAFLARISK